jgi:SPP1 gp7 family putative phage head morphogenesis protein
MPIGAEALRIRRYLVEIGAEKRRKKRRIPEPRFPTGAKLLYRKHLRSLQRILERAVRETIFRNLEDLEIQSRIERPDSIHVALDTGADTIERLIENIRFTVGQSLDTADLDLLANDVGRTVADANKRETSRILQSAIGIDPIAAEPWMAGQMSAFRKENVSLIKSLIGDQLSDIETILQRGQRRGIQVRVLREQIQKKFDVSKSKADLLARDQTNKLNGELTQLRQESLGIKEYIWRTSGDDRVRQMHIDLDGTRQKWSDPPVTNPAGDRNHPGFDYQCRCYSEPIVEELLKAAS